jgi:hypothetical protein
MQCGLFGTESFESRLKPQFGVSPLTWTGNPPG